MAKDLDKPEADETAQFRTEVALRLKKAREDAGLTQSELAQRIGITQQQISYAESGEKLLGTAKIVKLADALGVTTDYLLTGKTLFEEYDKELLVWFASLTKDQKDDLLRILKKGLSHLRQFK